MKILLHICCGPCAITPVQTLRDEGHEVVGCFYNPNIHPLTEYLRRRDGLREVADRLGLQVIWLDREYDPATYLRRVAFREDNRCFHCYHLRLERSLSIARHGGFQAFTSTLLYSRHQKHDTIAGLGRDLASGKGVDFLYRDFRTKWQQGIEQSKSWGIYRQPYCGCVFSESERYQGRLKALQSGQPG
ncbi:MAG: epoxyqueuosine reductase QueH [Desulfohalobiaceae bacterium]